MSLPPHTTSMLASRLALTRSTHASIRLLATYPRLRFRAAPGSSSSSVGYGSRRSAHTATAAKLYTPDVPLVVPTSNPDSTSASSSNSNNHLENPCLNHPTESTGLAHESENGGEREFGMADAWGLKSEKSKKNKKQLQADGEGGLSDEELNRMALEKIGKAQASGSGSSKVDSAGSSVASAASTVSSAISSAAEELSGSSSTPTLSSKSTTDNEYVEIEQESIGRSTRPATSSSASSTSPASTSTSTAAPASGTSARKAGRTIGLKGKKNAITLTPSAISRLAELADPETTSPTSSSDSSSAAPQLLRISVRNRGCAGLAYHLSYLPTDAKSKFDEIVEQDGVRVLIDSRALFSVVGSEMDWVEDRMSARFVFKNPNVKDACGCGESFHV